MLITIGHIVSHTSGETNGFPIHCSETTSCPTSTPAHAQAWCWHPSHPAPTAVSAPHVSQQGQRCIKVRTWTSSVLPSPPGDTSTTHAITTRRLAATQMTLRRAGFTTRHVSPRLRGTAAPIDCMRIPDLSTLAGAAAENGSGRTSMLCVGIARNPGSISAVSPAVCTAVQLLELVRAEICTTYLNFLQCHFFY